jgi:CRP/FNR family transcriptional regulator
MQQSQVSNEKQIETFLTEITQYPLFQNIERQSLLKLFTGARLRSSKHREVLYRVTDPAKKFAVVLRGAYKLVRSTPRGDDVIVYFAAPGDAIAALVMSQENSAYPVSAIAMGPSLVLEIPRETFIEHWALDAEISRHLQNILFSRMILLQDEKLFMKAPLELKVAHLILQLIEKYSAEADGILPIPITRREIADNLGSSIESVIRIMSDWSHKNIIATTEQHIEILEAGKIAEMIQRRAS